MVTKLFGLLVTNLSFSTSEKRKVEGGTRVEYLHHTLCSRFPYSTTERKKEECGGWSAARTGSMEKICFWSQKGSVKGEIPIIVVLRLRMNVEECVNFHALCFEMRTRVLESKFLIYPHYGVWGRYNIDIQDTEIT